MKNLNILIVRNNQPHNINMLPYDKEHIQMIKKISPAAEVNIVNNDKNIIDRYIKNTDILMFTVFDHIDVVKAGRLKWIHSTSAGVTKEAAILKSSPILLTNSSGVHSIPISEHVFAYLLMFVRAFNKSYKNQIVNQKWNQDFDYLNVDELFGKTIAIVGYGRIGRKIAFIAKAFGMKVIAYNSIKKKPDATADIFYGQSDLDNLLKESDFIINCLPLSGNTKRFFDIVKFRKMKSGAFFVNIGRGQTVNEKDLVASLKLGKIAGAGLDVFESEPLSSDSELWNLDNVIVTPHYAGYTPKYLDRVMEIFCRNLKAFIADKKLPNLVNKNKGY